MVLGRSVGARAPPRAQLVGFCTARPRGPAHSRSEGSRRATRPQERADTVRPGREARVACGVGPSARKKRELAPCSMGRKGGGGGGGGGGGLAPRVREG